MIYVTRIGVGVDAFTIIDFCPGAVPWSKIFMVIMVAPDTKPTPKSRPYS
jgi:hypothetical protein